MRFGDDIRVLAPDEFARLFPLRAPNLMWLLGAGASASAGVPTAGDMVWEFKQQLYVSQRRVSLNSVSDLSNPAIRNQLQSYIDSSKRYPPADSPDEYAALFEAAWPDERDRRTYIDGKLSGAKPSYGHMALATLTQGRLAKIIWTTNFDPLVADAAAKVFESTGALTTIALDAPDLAADSIANQRWPIEIKLHGDFRSRRLKNTSDELRQQDALLRREFVDACRSYGLVVVGYSGRDDSIMDSLSDGLTQNKNPFPGGLFWLHRGDDPPLPRVIDFLRQVTAKGVDGGLVPIINFDEVLRDLLRLCGDLDTTVLDAFAAERRRWTPPPQVGGKRGWPVVRLNAIPVIEFPAHCRRVVCSVGGTLEVREAAQKVGTGIIAARLRAGVLAFGRDADLKMAFDSFGITEFDLYAIDSKRLRFETGERGLLSEALSTALARRRGLILYRRRNSHMMALKDPANECWQPLRKLVGKLSGAVDGDPSLRWSEGISLRLDWAADRPWLIIEPRTIFEGLNADNKALAASFARERTVRRYNQTLNNLIAFWVHLLAQGGTPLRALDIGDGVDAAFRLGPDTAFSWRAQA
jgi:SIR2-like domain